MLNRSDYIHVGTDEAYNNYNTDSAFKAEIESVYQTMEYRTKIPDLLGKTLLVTDKQFPKIHQIASELSAKMEMECPAIYVFEDFFYGMESYGMGDYWIEVSAKTIRDFTYQELTFLLAREFYKIKNNVVYHTMLMNQMFKIQAAVPAVGDALQKISRTKFNHWCRLENYTADNFGYLMCGDLTSCVHAIVAMILNSKSLLSQVDMGAFIKQSSNINKLDDVVSNYTKSDEVLPYAPLRVESLMAYAVSRRGIDARKEVTGC